MNLKTEHGKALSAIENKYELTSRNTTTGLASLGSDINAYNSYGMTPIQVALQAGALDEVNHIKAQPGIEPLKLSRSNNSSLFYISVFQQTNGGSNPFTGQTETTPEGKAIDKIAAQMKDILGNPAQAPAPAAKMDM